MKSAPTLAKRFGYIMVVSVLPDSPAEKAGLRTGDILEAIAGFTTRDMSVGQANALLAGAPGSMVKVGCSAPRQHRAARRDHHPRGHSGPASHRRQNRRCVAYVRIPALQRAPPPSCATSCSSSISKACTSSFSILRDCARGPVSEGVAAAQLFVPSGTIAALRGQTVSRQEFDADADKVVWHGPVEVLISDSTSGAAEVLAAALGDNHRADLVGERTFGTAAEQKLIPLEDGSAMILTVAYYYTPAGKAILEDGVVPTVQVVCWLFARNRMTTTAPAPLGANQRRPGRSGVRKALDLLKNGARKAAYADRGSLRPCFGR